MTPVAQATGTEQSALPAAAPSSVAPPAAPELPSAPATTAVPGATAASGTAAEPSDPKTQEFLFRAKFGEGVLFGTADEQFTVNLRSRFQFQLSYLNPNGDDNDVTQASIRRARLLLQGNVYGPELTYYIQLGFSNRDTEPDLRLPLRDAYANWGTVRDLNVRGGQMKVPYGRQRVTSSSAQGMVDRSIVVAELNLDRDVGLQVLSKDLFGLGGVLGYSVGIFGGDGRNRLAERDGYLYVARVNICPFGSFDDNVEADITRDPRPRLAIGGGAAFNNQSNRERSTFDGTFADESVAFDYAHYGADMTFKWNGFFLISEWMLRTSNQPFITGEDAAGDPADYYAREAWGAYAQVGQMVTDHLEFTARFGHLEPLDGTDPDLVLTQELGGGSSYYFEQHNLKIQADYFYYAYNPEFADGSHQLRMQGQLFF